MEDNLQRCAISFHPLRDLENALNQCGEGQPWGNEKFCTLYPSKISAPVVTFIHPGNHKFHEDAPAAIVKFFKEHAKP